MRRWPRALATTAAAAFLLSPAFAEESVSPEEAHRVQTQAESIRSYQTRFTLEAQEETGEPVTLEGTLLFEQPNRRRLELKEGPEQEPSQLLISDGTVEWQSYPAANTVYRARSPELAPGPHRPFSEVQPGSVRFLEKIESGRDKRVRFEAIPLPSVVEGSPVPIQTMRIEVAEQDGLVRELVLLDAQGEPVLTQRYLDLKVNVSIPEENFQFTPPEGFRVVDIDEEPEEDKGNRP